jgi:hypothetical protein
MILFSLKIAHLSTRKNGGAEKPEELKPEPDWRAKK